MRDARVRPSNPPRPGTRERLVALELREIARELADVMRSRRHFEARERTLRSVQMNLLRGRITVAEARALLQATDLEL